MKFWDASAIVPLLVEEPDSAELTRLAREDPGLTAWWGTPVECASAITRLGRDGALSPAGEQKALDALDAIAGSWVEVLPTTQVRSVARRVLRVHPLRAADALQLAAAIVWADNASDRGPFVTRDDRLATAARKEGFSVI